MHLRDHVDIMLYTWVIGQMYLLVLMYYLRKKLRMWLSIVQQVHKWLYSWMTPCNVEDEEEYEISKNLFEKFICSQTVLDEVGEHWFLVYKIIKFLRGQV